MSHFTHSQRTNRQRLAQRFAERHPSFLARLKEKEAIAGWGDNPWHDDTSDNGMATAIARRYIDAFTDELISFGYLPFCGVELNFKFLTPPNYADAPTRAISALKDLYNLLQEAHAAHYPAETLLPRAANKLHVNSTIHGRMYKDGVMLEIATPVMSPAATVARVNDWKRILYEGSREYAALFAESGGTDPHPPQSLAARYFARQFGDYDLTYLPLRVASPTNNKAAARYGVTGEHFNWSLVRTGAHHPLGYHNAKDDLERFAMANVMYDQGWKQLCQWGFERLLPSDSLLVYGSPLIFDQVTPYVNTGMAADPTLQQSKHHFGHKINLENANQVAEGSCMNLDARSKYPAARIEARSFHTGASNVTLSALTFLAASRAILLCMQEDRDIMTQFRSGDFDLTDSQRYRMVERLHEKYRMDHTIPGDYAQMQERFNHSITLAMLRDHAMTHAPDLVAYEQELAVIEQFKQCAQQRALRLDRSNRSR